MTFLLPISWMVMICLGIYLLYRLSDWLWPYLSSPFFSYLLSESAVALSSITEMGRYFFSRRPAREKEVDMSDWTNKEKAAALKEMKQDETLREVWYNICLGVLFGVILSLLWQVPI